MQRATAKAATWRKAQEHNKNPGAWILEDRGASGYQKGWGLEWASLQLCWQWFTVFPTLFLTILSATFLPAFLLFLVLHQSLATGTPGYHWHVTSLQFRDQEKEWACPVSWVLHGGWKLTLDRVSHWMLLGSSTARQARGTRGKAQTLYSINVREHHDWLEDTITVQVLINAP